MQVKIKKLDPNAVVPSYAREGDAAMDLTAISKKTVDESTSGYIEYGTGLALEIPEGFAAFLFPRSSISNTGLILANAVGVVDSGYRGEVKLRFKAIPRTADYKVGDRVAQMIILPVPYITLKEVEELETSERGEGGFGSTNEPKVVVEPRNN